MKNMGLRNSGKTCPICGLEKVIGEPRYLCGSTCHEDGTVIYTTRLCLEREINSALRSQLQKVCGIAERLANHLMHCGYDETNSSSLKDWKSENPSQFLTS